jgi:hypothetical protein
MAHENGELTKTLIAMLPAIFLATTLPTSAKYLRNQQPSTSRLAATNTATTNSKSNVNRQFELERNRQRSNSNHNPPQIHVLVKVLPTSPCCKMFVASNHHTRHFAGFLFKPDRRQLV